MNARPQAAAVILVGAGAAGLSCALWLQSHDVPFRWLDACGRVGGTLHRVHHPVENYPGWMGATGAALAQQMAEQVARRGLLVERAFVECVDPAAGRVYVAGEAWLDCDSMVLATGTSPRRLALPGEAELEGRWIFHSSHVLAPSVRGARVLVVGGGDGAFEAALVLARAGAAVTLIHRSRSLRRVRARFAADVAANPAIEVVLGAQVRAWEVQGDALTATLDLAGQRTVRSFAAAVLKIGVVPNLPAVAQEVTRDASGHLVVDGLGRTTLPGLFAIGDVAANRVQSVATAAAQGAIVADVIAASWLARGDAL